MPIPATAATPRLAMMTVFAAFGAAVGALAGSVPAVTRAAGINDLGFGLALTASTFCTVLMLSLGGTIARFASNRMMLLWSLPLFALMLMATLISTHAAWFYVIYLGLGLMFGLTDIFMNAEGVAIEIDLGKPIFSTLHAAVSLGMSLMALLSSYLSTQVGTWSAGLATMMCFAAAWWMVYRLIPGRRTAAGRAARLSSVKRKLPLVLLGTAVGFIVAAETAAILWSAKLLDVQAPEFAAVAGAGAAFYGLCNAAFRLIGDWLRERLGDLPLMMGSLLIAIAGFAALGLSQSFTASVMAFAVVGFGTAVLVPCAFALAAGFMPGNRAAGISFISIMSAAPRIAAPWAFGWLVTATAIGVAFGVFAGVLAVALILIVTMRNLQETG